jgi:putative transposase
MPHHVTQRGNRRLWTFFNDEDYQAYLELMSEWCTKHQVQISADCLMPNHVHLIAVPETKDSLKLAIGKAHRRYTRRVNFRQAWRGHLWQGRFSSFILEQNHLFRLYAICGIKSSKGRYGEKSAIMALEQRRCSSTTQT